MLKKIGVLLAFSLSFCVSLLHGQPMAPIEDQAILITGKIVDAQSREGLEFATVQLFDARDSTAVSGKLSNKQGEFSLKAGRGEYYLAISFLGYEKRLISDIDLKRGDRSKDLGTLAMKPAEMAMDEVEITSKKSQVEFKLDKRVYNVSKDLTAIGSSADELLQNLPSVEVDGEGNVSLRGSQNVRILINGKPSGILSGGPDALRLLQGNQIERIEIITNPSAKYDAEGEVGIINIILKENSKRGLNGSFSLDGGYPSRFGASANVNLRRDWFNLFVNAGVNYRNAPGQAFFTQTNTFEDTSFTFITDREFFRGGWTPTLRFGSEFFINEKNTITLAGNFQWRNGDNLTRLTYSDFDEGGDLTQITERVTSERESRDSYGLEGNYTKTFDQKDRKWTVDFNFDVTNDTELSDVDQTLVEGNGNAPADQRISNIEDRQTFFLQTDYVQPFGNGFKFETGGRASYRTFNNDYKVESFIGGEWVPLDEFFNQFIYLEGIYAGYGILSQELDKLSYQVGLRVENTDIVTESVKDNERNPRNYTNFFPSAGISYKIRPTTTLQFSYSRRISRPDSWTLIPFRNFADARNTYEGNPFLNPEFTQSFETGFLDYQDKGSFLASIYYRYRTDVIERITVFEQDRTRMIPINLSTQHAFGLEASVSRDLFDWWKMSANANFSRAITSGVYEDSLYEADTYILIGRANSRWIWDKVGNLQATFSYRSPRITTQGRSRAVYALDLGLSRDIFNGKGSVSFNVRDVFNSRKYRSTVTGPTFTRELLYQRRLRQYTISLTYQLNQDPRKNRGGGDRAGGGDFDY